MFCRLAWLYYSELLACSLFGVLTERQRKAVELIFEPRVAPNTTELFSMTMKNIGSVRAV